MQTWATTSEVTFNDKNRPSVWKFPLSAYADQYEKKKPFPAVDFAKSIASVGGLFNQKQKIYIKPTEHFVTKFRQIFTNTKTTYKSGQESRAYPAGPNMKYWPQQLNCVLCCATTCCGILRDILRGMQLRVQQRLFFQFHIYFTVRILSEIGSIQSVSTFLGTQHSTTQTTEFALSLEWSQRQIFASRTAQTTFLGLFSFVSRYCPTSTGMGYHSSHTKFHDEVGTASQGNQVAVIRNDINTGHQFDYFVPINSLTQAGLSPLNQTIKAFEYCVLGSPS